MNKYKQILVFFFITFFISNTLVAQNILEISDSDFVIGSKDAPITMIEYASLSCGHCANFHTDSLPVLKKEYVDTGKLKIVFRDFPFNYPALLGSMMLRCIPSDVRYDYMNALFMLQNNWVNRENKKTKQELFKIMQSGGMTKDEFDICYKNKDIENEILLGVMNAQNEFNIKSTPSFLINGKLIEGNKSIKEFKKIIDNILSE